MFWFQAAAETEYDVVSPDSPVKRGQNRLAQQPFDLREGVSNAYQVFREGLGQTATNIVQVAKDEHEQKGVTGAVGGVLRQVPATVVQPLILATEATSNVLGGVRNQILPDARREAAEKWRASPWQEPGNFSGSYSENTLVDLLMGNVTFLENPLDVTKKHFDDNQLDIWPPPQSITQFTSPPSPTLTFSAGMGAIFSVRPFQRYLLDSLVDICLQNDISARCH